MRCLPFIWLYLWFSWISLGEIFQIKVFTVHWILRDRNFKHEKSRIFFYWQIFRLLQICLLPLQKNWSGRFRRKTSSKVKYLLQVCQILRNFTVGNARKFTVSFAFCTRVGVIKYRKTLTFSFERAQITWLFVLGARAIVKL